jgi:DNA-binding XRE family transcriptional regulator
MFVITGLAKHFEGGNPKYIAGKSGVELARETIETVKAGHPCPEPGNRYYKTPEYWAGWVLAQYQWYVGLKFQAIFRSLPFSAILSLYPTHHEADITKFFATATHIVKQNNPETNLRRLRAARDFSQARLAVESGVSVRSIRMYEQLRNDINKAQALMVARLARALCCDIDDVLEYAALDLEP